MNFWLINFYLKIRVYARNSANDYLDHALNVAKRSLDYLENQYLQISEAVSPKIGKFFYFS